MGRNVQAAGRIHEGLALSALLAVAALIRLPLLANADRMLDSDIAFNALAVRHLLRGHAFFLYYPGQDYQGITEGLLGVLLTQLFGWSAAVYLCASLTFYLTFIVFAYLFAREAFGMRAAWMTSVLAALSPAGMLWNSLLARGGHVYVLMAGAAMLWMFVRYQKTARTGWLCALMFTAGFSFYTYKLSLVVIAPVFLCLVYQSGFIPTLLRDSWGRSPVPARPAWLTILPRALDIALVVTAWAVVCVAINGECALNAGVFRIHVDTWRCCARTVVLLLLLRLIPSGRIAGSFFRARLRPLALGGLFLVIGLSPFIAARFVAPPDHPPCALQGAGTQQRADNFDMLWTITLPDFLGYAAPAPESKPAAATVFTALVYAGALAFLLAIVLRREALELVFVRAGPPSPERVLLLTILSVLGAYVFSNYIIDATSNRYLIPLFAVVPPAVARAVDRLTARIRLPALGWTIIALFCAAHIAQGLAAYRDAGVLARHGLRVERPAIGIHDVIDSLRERGICAAYGSYWIAYRLTFLTDEHIVVAPYAGINERRPPDYASVVRTNPNPAYLFLASDSASRGQFNEWLQAQHASLQVSYFKDPDCGIYAYSSTNGTAPHRDPRTVEPQSERNTPDGFED